MKTTANAKAQTNPLKPATKAESKRKIGRPTLFTQELADQIVEVYRTGTPVYKIAKLPGMPDATTIERWQDRHDAFAETLARADRSRASEVAAKAGQVLEECDPSADAGKNASARVQLAQHKSGYYRWMASCLDRKWNPAGKVELDIRADLNIQAFADKAMQARAVVESAAQVAAAKRLPGSTIPDGTGGEN